MVAVITGSGLGLGNSSLRQLGMGLGGQAGIGQAGVAQYLNAANGNLLLQNADENLIFDGLSLNSLRTYNSQGQLSGNNGWQFGFSRSVGGLTGTVNTAGSTVTRTDDDGTTTTYAYNATSGLYVSTNQAGAQDTLAWNASTSTWSYTDSATRLKEAYGSTGQLTTVSDPETGASYAFTYTGGQLATVTSGDGDKLVFGYNTSHQLISLSIQEIPPGQTTAVTRQQVGYQYDSQGRLQTVTTTLGSDTDSSTASYTTVYGYDGTSDRVASITQSDGTTVHYTYTANAQNVYQVTGITTGTGSDAQTLTLAYNAGSTTLTNALGQTWTYTYNALNQLTQVTAPVVNGSAPTTTYQYDTHGNLLQSFDATGAKTVYGYDAQGNLLSVEDATGHTVSYTYNADDQLLTQTTYTVPAQGTVGQSGYVAPSGAQTTYHVYDASDRLSYVIDPLGDVTAYTYSTSNGVMVLSSTQQYRGTTYSLTNASPSTPPTLAALQAWVATTAVKATLPQSARTDYTYDVRGQLSLQTQWDTVDANGNGVSDVGTTITKTVYDAQGRLLQTITERGASRTTLETTSYAYDGLGRLIGTTDALGNATSYLYTDATNTLTITQANGLTTTQVRNTAGLLISSTQWATAPANGTTITLSNAEGQPVAVIDPQGGVAYTFYDTNGRISGSVDVTGEVTAYIYDAAGDRLQTTQYATPIDTSGWMSNGAFTASFPATIPKPAANAGDQITSTLYDPSGRVVATIDAGGYVIITARDAAGNPISATSYATALTSDARNALGSSPTLAQLESALSPSASDRSTETIYDANNRVIATIDANGFVNTIDRDATGNVSTTRSYSSPLTPSQIQALGNSPTLSDVLAAVTPSSNDQTELYIYDDASNKVATVDAAGNLVTFNYDSAGNLLSSISHMPQLTSEQLTNLETTPTSTTLQFVLAQQAFYGIIPELQIYDVNGRVVGTTDGNGSVNLQLYDGDGNLAATLIYSYALNLAQLEMLDASPTLATLQSLVSGVPLSNVFISDGQGHLTATVGSTGLATVTSYNASGLVTANVQYSNPLTLAQLEALAANPTLATLTSFISPSDSDTSNVTIYDADNRVVATVTSEYTYQASNGWNYYEAVNTTTYNAAGSVTGTTQYANLLTPAQVNALGTAPTIEDLQSILSPSTNDITSLTIYDASNRVVATVSSPQYVYNYSTGYTSYGSKVTTSTYDDAGHLTSTATYANTLSVSQVASLGDEPSLASLKSLITPNLGDQTALNIYDANENLVATVTPNYAYNYSTGHYDIVGSVTTHSNDEAGNPTSNYTYTTSLTASDFAALVNDPTIAVLQSLVTASPYDYGTLTVYNSDELAIGQVDSQGYVTTNSYDDQGNVTTSTKYSTPLTPAQLASLGTQPTQSMLMSALGPASAEHTTYITIHDTNGRLIATVTPDAGMGSLVALSTYDSAGNEISYATYATALSQAQVDSLGDHPTVAAIQAQLSPSPSDYIVLTIYDASENVVATVSPSGIVSTINYDSNGNISGTRQYAVALSSAQIASLATSPTLANLQKELTPSADDAVSVEIHDSQGRQLADVGTSGNVFITSFDSAGRLSTQTNYQQSLTQEQMLSLAESPSLDLLLGDLAADQSETFTQTIYDAAGHAVATVDAGGNVQTTGFDANGNATSVTTYANPISGGREYFSSLSELLAHVQTSSSDTTTYTVYDANNRIVATVDATGHVISTNYDSSGHVVSTVSYSAVLTASQLARLGSSPTLIQLQALLGPVSRAIYNAAGQAVAIVDAKGNISYTFYDADGRVSGTVDPTGAVITYSYDTSGRRTQTTQYATLLNTAGWASTGGSLGSLPSTLPTPAANTDDRTTSTLYDTSGNVVATVDAGGHVVTTTYDGAGNAIATTAYSTALTNPQRAALGGSPTLSSLQADLTTSLSDRTTQWVYNANHRVVATVDADGFVVVDALDASGNTISTVAYATALTTSQREAFTNQPTLATLQANVVSSIDDQKTFNYYDSLNRVVAQVDADGYLTTQSYDETTHSTVRTRYAQALSESQFDGLTESDTASGLVALLGGQTSNEQITTIYNADNQVISLIAADGTVTSYTYNTVGELLSTTETPLAGQGLVRSTTTVYDSFGNVVSRTDAAGASTAYVYDALNQMIQSTDALGNSTWYYYDADGHLAYTVQGESQSGTANALGNLTSYTYNAFGQVTTTTAYVSQLALKTIGDSDKDTINTATATLSQLAAAATALPTSPVDANATTTVAYNVDGEVVSTTDGDGYKTADAYDAFGDIIQVQQQLGGAGTPLSATNSTTRSLTYDGLGHLVGQVNASGTAATQNSSATFDAFGRVTSTTDGDGNVISYDYDPLGRQISTSQLVQGASRASRSIYDAFGRILSSTDALGNVSTYQYDITTHQVVAMTPGGVQMTMTSDAYGDKVSVADSAGNTTSYAYDGDGRLLSTTDALGSTAYNQYDADGNLIRSTDASGHVVTTTYDSTGKVLTQTVYPDGIASPGTGRITTYTYDSIGRELSVTDPSGTVTTYSYDANGNVLTEVQDAGIGRTNQTTTYSYDGGGKILTVTVGLGWIASTTQYVYDALDRLTQKIVDPSGLRITTQYAYDADNNLVEWTDANGDSNFNVYNEANELAYSFTASGAQGSELGALVQNTYDADGRLVQSRAYASLVSTASLAGANEDSTNSRLNAAVALANTATTSQDQVSYKIYDVDGNTRFTIDPMGRVAETRYDDLGQVSSTLVYANAIVVDQSLALALQNSDSSQVSAQLTTRLNAAGNSDSTAQAQYFFYDPDGRLAYTLTPNLVNGAAGVVVSAVQYDQAGRKTADITYGVALPLSIVSADTTTASIALALAQAETSGSTRTTQYVYNGAGEKVAQVDPNGYISYTFYDADGHIAATVDPTGSLAFYSGEAIPLTGAVVEYSRDALGRVVQQTSFATAVDTTGWFSNGVVTVGLSDITPASDPSNDRITQMTYDTLGRLSRVWHYSTEASSGGAYQILSSGDVSGGFYAEEYGVVYTGGDVTGYTYNNASQVVETIDYDFGSGSSSSPGSVRKTSYFYDGNGNTVATIDADGYLTAYSYSASGQLTQSISYAQRLASAVTPGETLGQLSPVTSTEDQITTNYYDAFGNLVGNVDDDGYFTQYAYDLNNEQTGTTRYASAVPAASRTSLESIESALAGSAAEETTASFNGLGDLISTQNVEGSVTRYAYDAAGHVIQTTVAFGTDDARTTYASYDAFGNQTGTTDGVGDVTSRTYDLNGNLTSTTDALGNTVWYVYGIDNRLAATVTGVADSTGNANALGEISLTIYDTFGDVLATDNLAARASLGPNYAPSQTAVITQFLGVAGTAGSDQQTTYSYDLEGNVVSKYDANGNGTNYAYNAFNEVVLAQQTSYGGLTTQYTYDALGHMTSKVDEAEEIISSSGYGGCGPSYPYGGSSSGSYSDSSSSSSNYGSVIRELQWTYDAFGRVATYVDGDGATTTYAYDGLNQELSHSESVLGTTREASTSYDAYGRTRTTTDAMGLVTTYSYDDADRSMSVTSPGGVVVVTRHNREGQTIAVSDAAGDTTSYEYDGDGRLIKTTQADGSTLSDQYDQVGNLIRTQDADGHVVTYDYDAVGREVQQTVDPNGLNLVTSFTYDGRGLNVSVTDPNGVVTSYVHDGNGNVIEMVQDVGDITTHSNKTTVYAYNDLNEVVGSYISDGDASINDDYGTFQNNYSYDALGRLITETTDTGKTYSTTYAYDADGHVIQSTDASGISSYYVYDEAGEQIYALTPSGGNGISSYSEAYEPPTDAVVQNWYNADGQLTSTRQYATPIGPYDAIYLSYEIGTLSNEPRDTEAAISDVSALVVPSDADPVSYSIYDADGNLQFSIDPIGVVTENRYNSLGQLAETLVYSYPITIDDNLATNLQAGTATIGAIQSALSAVGNSDNAARITYQYYDADGRVSLLIIGATVGGQSGGAVKQNLYDADGNIISQVSYGDLVPWSQLGSGSTTGSISQYLASISDKQTTHYVYDAAGRGVYAVDSLGYATETRYDADGRVASTLQYANAISEPTQWTFAGTASAVAAANTDVSTARQTQNVYDGVGNLIQTFDTLGSTPSATYTYDVRGLKTSYANRDGEIWTYQYDSLGNLTSESSPAVGVANYTSAGSYLGVTQQSITTAYFYDGTGQLIFKYEAYGTSQQRITQYGYDFAGNLIQTTVEGSTQFDPTTGTLQQTGSNVTNATYNTLNQLVVTQDANGNYAYQAFDLDGRLTDSVDADGYLTAYQYNSYGQQTGVTRYANAIDTSALGDSWSDGQPLSSSQIQASIVPSASDRSLTTVYDVQGNTLSVTQSPITYTKPDGTTAVSSPTTNYTYDAYGNVTSQSTLVDGVAGQAGAVWATSYTYYDALGQKTMTVDPMGYVSTWSYDAFGDVASTTDWATAIATNGLIAGGTQPANPPAGISSTTGADRTTTYTYDNDGNKTSQSVLRTYVDATGTLVEGYVTTTFGYDGENRVISVTENGQTVTTQHDALGQVTSITGPLQPVLVSNWQAMLEADPSLTLTSASLYTMGSQVVSYKYDALGNKLTQTQSSTATSQSVTTYYLYDNQGNVAASVTPLDGSGPNWTSDQVKYMTYDSNGNLLATVSTLTGDDASSVSVTTSNTYDADNQLIASVTMRASTFVPDRSAATQYNAFGEVVASGDGIAINSEATYDNAGNRLTAIDPKTGELHTYGYNLAGQQVLDTVPLAAAVGGTTSTIFTRDLDGRVVAEQAPSTNSASGENTGTLSATYDHWGNVLSSTDASGNTTTYAYNDRNQVVTQTEAAVTVVSDAGLSMTTHPVKTSAYDAEGNLVSVTDENGNVTLTAVNALGQTIQTTDGAKAVTYVAYDALGNEVADQSGNGNITFKNVDALGRVVQQGDFVLSSDGLSRAATWQQAYVLDQAGNRLISYDGIGSAYLQRGDTTNAALHANYDGYDSQGRVIWSQDAAQRAASVADSHAATPGNWTQAPTNASFSQANVGWDSDPGWVIGNGQAAYEGSYGGNTVNQDRVPVVPGQTITALSPPILIEGPHGGGVVLINWYDANGQLISSSSGNIVAHDDSGQQSSVTGTAPAGAAFASVALNATNYGESIIAFAGTVTWDYVPPAGATSTGVDGSLIVWLPNGSYTQQPSNPDFEDGDTGWDKGAGWSIVQGTNTSNGSWVAGFNGNASGYIANQDRVPVTPGQTISASIQVSLYLSPDGAAAAGAVAIQWFDAAGNLISTSLGNVINSDHKGQYHTSSVTAGAPPGAAYASLAAYGSANGIGGVAVDAAVWNYQYIPTTPAGVVQDTYVYDIDGNLVGQTTADRDSETWNYNAYGQVTNHTDLSGANYRYTYDASTGALIGESDNWSPTAQGQTAPAYVTSPISTPNSSTDTYYADGQLATQTFADGSVYSYHYDANGNQTRVDSTTLDGNNQAVHTATQTTYDSHNRISNVQEINEITGATTLNETYTYDAAGNRREVDATSGGTTQNVWYTYDGDNRVVVSAGSLVNGVISITDAADSYAQTYDHDGNVIYQATLNAAGDALMQRSDYNSRDQLIRAYYAVDLTTGGASRGVEETRTYDADGHVLIDNQYYALGTTFGSLPDHHVNPDEPDSDDGSGTNVGGELDTATVNYYDVVGRLAAEQSFGHAANWDGTDGGAAPTSAPGVDATTYGSLILQSEVVYQGTNASAGYDADGDVVAYQYRDGSGRIDQYAVTYLRKDGYLQSTTSGENVSDTPNVRPSTDESVYDDRGNLVALTQHTQYAGGTVADTVRVFAYDGYGEIIERRDGTANGATLDQGTSSAHENQHYVYVNGQQVAHYDEGGTLDVLSEVTAFSSSSNGPNSYVVQAGDTLESIAQAEYGDSSLWYIVAQANALSSDSDLSIGQKLTIPQVTTNSNTATTYKPYDPSAVVGSTTPSLPTIAPPPPPPSSHCNALAEIVVIAVEIVVSVVAAPLGPIADAALVNVAGQLTGDIVGVHKGFNVGEVAVAAVTAGVGNDVAEALPAANGLLNNAIVGATTYATNVVASKALDEPTSFSWKGLLANSLGNVAYGEIQTSLLGGSYSGNILARAADDVVDRETSVALGDNHVESWEQIGEDVGGTALANLGFMGLQAYQQQLNSQPSPQAAPSSSNYDPSNPLTMYNEAGVLALGTQLGTSPSDDGVSLLGSAWQQQSDLGGANSALAAYNAANYQQGDAGLPTDAQMEAAINSGPQLAYVQPNQILSPFDLEPDTLSTDASGPLGPQTTPANVTRTSIGGVLGTSTTSGTNLGSSSTSGLLANQTAAEQIAEDGPNGPNGYIGNLDFTPSPSGELPPIDGISLPITSPAVTGLYVQDLVPSSLSPVAAIDAGSLVDNTPTSTTTISSLAESAGQGLADGIVDGLRPAGTFLGEEAGRIALGQYDQTLVGRGLEFLASEQNDVLSGNAQQTQTYQFSQAVDGTVSGIVDDPAAALNEGYNYAVGWASQGIESVANSLSNGTPDQIAYNISHGVGVVASGVGVGRVGETVLGAAGEIAAESAEPASDIGGANPANIKNLDPVDVNGSVPGNEASIIHPANNGAAPGPATVFQNQLPENLDTEIANARSLGVQPMSVDDPGFDDLINRGTIKYVVTDSGDLVVGPYSVDGTEISHAVLSNGNPVVAAGEAEIAGSSGDGYFGISLNVQSGHFLKGATQAQSAAATQIGTRAFAGYGIYF